MEHDVTFAQPGGVVLKLDVYRPEHLPAGRKLPVVVYFHGGGWRSGGKKGGAPYLEALAYRGFIGISADYRLSGQASFPAQLDDARAALAWAAQHAGDYGGDGTRIGVCGTSAGAHLAALLGTAGTGDDVRVRAVADWYGPADLRDASLWPKPSRGMIEELLHGTPAQHQDLAAEASPAAFASAGDPPFLIIHGDKDGTVPVGQSLELRSALETAGVAVQYVEVAGGGHGDFGRARTTELIETMAAFFHSNL
jgi:acetyl esterase/lipase